MMGTCKECWFWQRDPDQHPDAYAECGLPGKDARFDTGGYFTTRADFGCVQFEAKPIPKDMPIIYADAGERVEPIPGHAFHAPQWGQTVAIKIAIDDQWFEIRQRPSASPASR